MTRHSRTKKPLDRAFIFLAYQRDIELLRAAASQAEVSQSEFVRLALREATPPPRGGKGRGAYTRNRVFRIQKQKGNSAKISESDVGPIL